MKVRVEFDLSAADLAAIAAHYKIKEARAEAARTFLWNAAIAHLRPSHRRWCMFEDCKAAPADGSKFCEPHRKEIFGGNP